MIPLTLSEECDVALLTGGVNTLTPLCPATLWVPLTRCMIYLLHRFLCALSQELCDMCEWWRWGDEDCPRSARPRADIICIIMKDRPLGTLR